MEQQGEDSKKTVITRQMVREATERICAQNGLDAAFLEDFWQALLQDDEVYTEYVHYLVYGDFDCRACVASVTVADVLIWQIDHFKAQLDVDTTLTKRRRGSMVLLAFDTFLKMKREPEKYLPRFREDTGTDYPGKFNPVGEIPHL